MCTRRSAQTDSKSVAYTIALDTGQSGIIGRIVRIGLNRSGLPSLTCVHVLPNTRLITCYRINRVHWSLRPYAPQRVVHSGAGAQRGAIALLGAQRAAGTSSRVHKTPGRGANDRQAGAADGGGHGARTAPRPPAALAPRPSTRRGRRRPSRGRTPQHGAPRPRRAPRESARWRSPRSRRRSSPPSRAPARARRCQSPRRTARP